MGMTIKDTKMHLYMQKSYALGKDYRALEKALDIIRKYEKIQEIVKVWEHDDIDYEGHYGDDYMEKISEVVEDDNT